MTLAVNKTQDQTMFPTTVGGRSMGLFRQRFSETITYLIDYSQWLDDGDTISSSTFVISPQTAPAVVTSGTTIQDGNKILFQIDNGKENTRYVVTVEITTSTGQVKNDYFQLNIGTPPGDAMQSGIDTALSAAQVAQVGAQSAQTAAVAAQTGAQTARTGAEIARTGAETALASAVTARTAAEAAATLAQNKAGEAQNAQTAVATNAQIASNKADEAWIQAIAAGQSATTATTKASEAAASATSAANSASTATTKANEAAASANTATNNATTSTTKANEASASAINAAASAATATTKAGEAATFATNAATSATTASNNAAAASTSATNAATSATNAANSATAAASARTAAESARDATLAAYDSFDDRYLGVKSSDPTLDNDGNTLLAGTLYFNSVNQSMRLYTGSAWVAAYVSGDVALLKANNLSDLTNVATARTNLGLATVAATGAYGDLSGRPSLAASATTDTTNATNISSGTLSNARLSGVALTANNLSDLASASTARTNLGLSTLATTTPGTGVATALGVAVGSAGAVVTNGGALGTPASGTLTNTTGLPLTTGVTGTLPVANGGTGVTTSTGTGSVVLSNSPTFVTPALGTPSSGNLANCTFPTLNQNTTGTASNVTGTVAVANGGTGVTSLTTGRIPFGNGTSAFGNSANLFWDNTNNQLDLAAGTAALPALSTVSDNNTGIFFPAADTIAVGTGGSEHMRLTSAGNVGIGTATPTHKVDVNGSARSTSLYVQNTRRVLDTYEDGSSNIIFAAEDYNGSYPFLVDTANNTIVGTGNVTSGTNRATELLYIPIATSAPTGTPLPNSGRVPIVFCTGDSKLYIHNGTSWLSATFA